MFVCFLSFLSGRIGATSSDSDENYNKSSSSPELVLEAPSSDPSAGESDEQEALAGNGHLPAGRQHTRRPHLKDLDEGYRGGVGGGIGIGDAIVDPNSNISSNSNSIEDDDDDDEGAEEEGSGSVGVSLSDSVDAEDDDDGDCEDGDDDDDDQDDDDDDDDDIMSSSGDDLPVDEHQVIVGDVLDLDNSGNDACGDAGAIHGSNSSRNSSSGGKISSRSDNTTHSYSSLLLEEEDDIVPASLHFPKDFTSPDLDVSNGKLNIVSSSLWL